MWPSGSLGGATSCNVPDTTSELNTYGYASGY